MNGSLMTHDIFDHDFMSPVGNLSPTADDTFEVTDAAFEVTDAAFAGADAAFAGADDTLSALEETYPMAELVDQLRVRFDWSWDIVDVLTDEQLKLLAFSVGHKPR